MLGMVRVAMREGKIDANTVVVEATSGNSGIALASMASVFGFYRAHLHERIV